MEPYVLVVDDDDAIREMITAVLEDEGIPVAVAPDGHAALQRIHHQPPALVLLDLNMPGMDGWTLHRHLRQDGFGAPIIFMTAAGRARQEAKQHGADDYLAKPFALTELLDLIERYT